MAFSTTNDQIYILEMSAPFDRLNIQFIPEINMSRSAKFVTIAIPNRNNDLIHYVGGTDTLSMKLDFLSDEENREDVIRKYKWLQSLAMRDGDKSGAARVKVVMGKVFRFEEWVVKSVKVKPIFFDSANKYYPIRASVDMSFMLDPDSNLLKSDVRFNG